ncbi:MAG: NHL repeat-containing protein [Acidimicrobiales bacterium]
MGERPPLTTVGPGSGRTWPRGQVPGRAAACAVTICGLLTSAMICGLLTSAAAAVPAFAGAVVTVAGTGRPGFSGDGGPARRARIDAPGGIAVDRSGDLFIADAGNCRVREVPDRSGTSFGRILHRGRIATVFGRRCAARGGAPVPTAVAVDRRGDLFVASTPVNRVYEVPVQDGRVFGRRVRAGSPVVVAGTGVAGDRGNGGPAAVAMLDHPGGVAVDSTGDIFISETAGCRVQMVAGSDGLRFGRRVRRGGIYTVAGTGTCGSGGASGPAMQAELWDPGALAVDSAGDLFVADQGNRSVRVLAARTGNFNGVAVGAGDLGTVAGEGSYGPYLTDGLSATGPVGEVNFPSGLAVAADGNLFVADGGSQAIRMVPAVATELRGRLAEPGDLYTVAGAMPSGSLSNTTGWVATRMIDPTGIAVGPAGNLFYSDSVANVVRELPGVP